MADVDDHDQLLNEELTQDQVRPVPNPELAHQHEETLDPLDLAIDAEHEAIEEASGDDVTPDELVELVLERVQAERSEHERQAE